MLKTSSLLVMTAVALALAGAGFFFSRHGAAQSSLVHGGLDKTAYFELLSASETWKFRFYPRYGWQLAEPFSYPADSEAVAQVLYGLSVARVSGPLSSQAQERGLYGLSGATARLACYDDLRRQLFSVSIGAEGPVADSRYVLGEDGVVRLAESFPRLDPSGAGWNLLDRTVVPLPGGPGYVRVIKGSGEGFEVSQSSSGWRVLAGKASSAVAEGEDLSGFLLAFVPALYALRVLPYQEFTPGREDLTLELAPYKGKGEFSVRVGPARNGERLAVRAGEGRVAFVLAAETVDALLKLAPAGSSFRGG